MEPEFDDTAKDIVINLARKSSELTPSDLDVIRETVKMVLSADESDRSFRFN